MKLKEIERTAVQAWSSATHHPIYLATGTPAQQMDAFFSSSATLEIFEVNFSDPSLEMKNRGSLSTSSRFHKLIWGSFGNGASDSSGVIAGGGDDGLITLYSASRILSSAKEPEIGHVEKHTGPVQALDFNPFQANLLASGANDSEIYIWDLNNFSIPMTPGTKSQPQEDIRVVAWNQQVQHILSSAHPSGKVIVWDLRKNEPIIKIGDHSNRMHCSGMAWHPEIATQLVLSSEDDRMPVVQLWDLRFATSPLNQLEGHTRGILSISWSRVDPELLLSSAKDNRILCWNPCTGEVVYELPMQNQWCFDVQWCPRNPSAFSAASFNGWLSIYSVMGGSLEAQQKTQADKISSSFNNLDPFGTGQSLLPLQVSEQMSRTTLVPPLKTPPKWIRRPTGASFAFGGKIITFGLAKAPAQPMQKQPLTQQQVFISQVVTETEFLTRSKQLQVVLQAGNLLDFCQKKIQAAQESSEENVWNFLKVKLEQESRTKLLKLLGYNREDLQRKIVSYLGNGTLDKQSLPESDDLRQTTQTSQSMQTSTGRIPSSSQFFDTFIPQDMAPMDIPVTADTDGLIGQALLIGDFPHAVELSMRADRFADAIILAMSGGEKLLKETQKQYFAKKKTKISLLLSAIVQQNWREVVCTCDLKSWKEALAILLTYSKHKEYTELCDMLGARLESEGRGALSSEASLCYISSGNVERLVECWVGNHDTSSPLVLQDLLEKVMVLTRSLEMLQGTTELYLGPILAKQLLRYVNLLASQGCLEAALNYLPKSSGQVHIEQLRNRLFHAQSKSLAGQKPSSFTHDSVHTGTVSHLPAASKASSTPIESASKVDPRYPAKPACQPYFTPPGLTQQSVPFLGLPQSAPAMPVPPSRTFAAPTTSIFSQGGTHVPYSQSGLVPTTISGPAVSMPQPFNLSGARLPGPLALRTQPPAPGLPSASGAPAGFGPPLGPTFFTPASVPLCPPAMPHQPATLLPPFPLNCPAAGSYPQGGPAAPSSNLPTPASESWNNPSALRVSLQRKKLAETFVPPAPITTPVMTVSAEPPGSLHPQLPVPQGVGQVPPWAPTGDSIQGHHLPTARIKKSELPPEHQVLKTVFEGLVQRCSAIATDAKTKRKLEDATQRLECLYEKLREQTLSQSILLGLHEMVRCVEARNYQQALAVHTQVVSSSDFSEVSGFMPILKALFTISQKLAV